MDSIFVGKLQDIPEDKFLIIPLKKGLSAGVVRQGDSILAYLNLCPHAGAPVCLGQILNYMDYTPEKGKSFNLHRKIISCPWHGWEFDLNSGHGILAKTGKLKALPVIKRADRIYLEIY